METIEALLQQSTSPNSSSSSLGVTFNPVTNFDDLIKDHHPHVLAPLQPTKYGTTPDGNSNPTKAAIDFIPPLPASSIGGASKQPPVIVGVAVKRTLRKSEEHPSPPQDAWPGGSMGETLERWHSDIFDCHPSPSAAKVTTADGDCNNNGSRHGNQTQIGAMMEHDDNDVGDLIDFSAEIEPAPAVALVGASSQVRFYLYLNV